MATDIGLGSDFELKDPLGLYRGTTGLSGAAPEAQPTPSAPSAPSQPFSTPGAQGEIRRGADGNDYQYAETTGMAGATGPNGWIRVNTGASPAAPAGTEAPAGTPEHVPGNPAAKGMARLAPPDPVIPAGKGGNLKFAHAGQNKLNPSFSMILTEASADIGHDFMVTSGFRSPQHPVEAAKKAGPGEHAHGDAADISMAGMDDAKRAQLVSTLQARGAKRFITYSNEPDMLHVDMNSKGVSPDNWFMYDRSHSNLGRAPKWFQDLAAGEKPSPASAAAAASSSVAIDEGFKPSDPLGLYRGADNPLKPKPIELRPFTSGEQRPNADGSYSTEISTTWQLPDGQWVNVPSLWMGSNGKPKQFSPDDEKGILGTMDAFEKKNGQTFARFPTLNAAEEAARARSAAGGAAAGQPAGEAAPDPLQGIWQGMEKKEPGRYQVIPAGEYEKWHKEWEASQSSQLVKGFKGALLDQNPELLGNAMEAVGVLSDVQKMKDVAGVVKDWGKQGSYKRQAAVGSVSDIRTDTWSNMISDAGSYAAYSLGSGVGSMVPNVAVGLGVGTATANPVVGFVAGAAGPSYIQNLGDVYGSLRDDPNIQKRVASGDVTQKQVAGWAAAAAVPMAALDSVSLGKVLNIAGGKAIKDRLVKRIAKGIIEGTLTEGTTEALQQVISETVQDELGANKPLADKIISVVDNFIGGALTGGVAGGAGHARAHAGPHAGIDVTPPPIADEAAPAAPGAQEPPAGQAPAPAAMPAPRKGPLASALDYGEKKSIERSALPPPQPAGTPAPPAGAPAIGATVRVDAPDIKPFMGTIISYHGDEAMLNDSASGEVYQIPIAHLTAIAPSVEEFAKQPPAGESAPAPTPAGTEPAPTPTEAPAGATPVPTVITAGMRAELGRQGYDNTAIREMSPRMAHSILSGRTEPDAADPALRPAFDEKAADTTAELPPREEQKPASQAFPGPPEAGQRVIVDHPGIPRFSGRIEGWDGDEAVVVDDKGTSQQVPMESLFVSKLQPKEVEAQDLARDPPVAREKAPLEATDRAIAGKTIKFPDAKHARLFDLGKMRRESQRTLGASVLDRDAVMPAEQLKLADDFGVTPEAAGQMADDYRYRAERYGKEARSNLPVKMHQVNERRLKQWQSDRAKAEPGLDAGGEDDLSTWWDGELTSAGRKAILDATGIKRSEKTTWRNMGANLRTKIAEHRNATTTPAAAAGEFDHDWVDDADRAQAAQDRVAATAPIDEAAHAAATSPQNDLAEPTQAQKEAGNYTKGHVRLGGMEISIENPEGSERKGVSSSGKAWSTKMKSHYGYIRGTIGKDKDHIDTFIKPGTADLADDAPVFVVDQVNADRRLDEHKVMMGYNTLEEARAAYQANYAKGWKGLGAITPTTTADFKRWLDAGDTKTPFSTDVDGKHPGIVEDDGPEVFAGGEKPTTYDPANDKQDYGAAGGPFPAPKATLDPAKGLPLIPQKTATERVSGWKAIAKQIGKDKDNSKKVIVSLFDETGSWSQPWRDAGYHVIQFDAALGDDIFYNSPAAMLDDIAEIGGKVVGVLAATPCTTFAGSGARWWEERHNVPNNAMVEKLFGPKAAQHFDTPVEANAWMVHISAHYVDLMKPEFHVLENPIGRIGEMSGLPKPLMRFDPADFGDPYTKRTQLWGEFDADLPTAPVEPSEGSKMQSKLRGDNPADKRERSKTPEGFAYAFFMANDPDARAALARADQARKPESQKSRKDEDGVTAIDPENVPNPVNGRKLASDPQNTLVLMACGSAKLETADAVHLLDLYTGPLWQDLRANGKAIPDVNKFVLSGKHGFSDVQTFAKPYEEKISKQKVDALIERGIFEREPPAKPGTMPGNYVYGLVNRPAGGPYTQVIIAGSGDYRRAFNAIATQLQEAGVIAKGAPIVATEGSILQQRKQFNEFLRSAQGKADETGQEAVSEGAFDPDKAIVDVVRRVVEATGTDVAARMAAIVREGGSNGELLGTFEKRVGQAVASAGVGRASGTARGATLHMLMPGPKGETVKPIVRAKNLAEALRAAFKDYEPARGTIIDQAPLGSIDDRFGTPEPAVSAEPAVKAVETQDKTADTATPVPAEPVVDNKKDWGAGNKLVTADRAEELRKKLKEKLRGQLSAGIDPEILAIGAELAAFHIEAGARRFADFAKAVAADMGVSVEKLRPFLRAWYNGARDLMEDSGVDIAGTDDAETVRAELAKLKDAPDAAAKLEGSGESALEGTPSDAVQVPAGSGDAGQGAGRSSEPDLFGSEPARGKRTDGGRGVADGEGGVPSPATGKQPGKADRPVDVAAADAGAGARPARNADRVEKPSERVSYPSSAGTPAALLPTDYTITDQDELGTGGQKAKFRGNVAAIRLLRTLEEASRPANRDEQAVLAKWVGWGGLRPAFEREGGEVNKGWEKEAAELKELLTPVEYRAAESSTRNAHYTSPQVVSAIWDIVKRLGFSGGQTLEPSIGAGNFIGLMPGKWRDVARVTGVELDHITGGIAKNLYPKANIVTPIGFQDFSTPNGHFDLAIGNPPFGSERLYDADRRELNKFSIHNFFFAKSIDALRPGGVLAMVVTNSFLDAETATARAYIAARADLLGAIRLPNTAFLENAGTEVTTDIVVLQKRAEGTPAADLSWVQSGDFRDAEGRTVKLNQYFKKHPEMMLGKFGAYGTMYRGETAALVARPDDDLPELLRNAIQHLPERVMPAPGSIATETVEVPNTVGTASIGSAFLSPEGEVFVRKPDSLGQPQAAKQEFANEAAKERVSGMIRVRDAFARLRKAQIDEKTTDKQLDELRARLNTVYDAFARKHGPINVDANKRLFRDDPTWPQISALEEKFDKGVSATVAKTTGETARGPSAQKAPIFTKRTQQPYKRPTSASSAKDALATVLADLGRVDLEAMSRLYGKSEDKIVAELGPLLWKTPAGAYETADAYLSGNVKAKLAEAQRAVATDPDFRRNVQALENVIPPDIEAVDINVKPGAPWVPATHVTDFLEHMTEKKGAKSFYSKANAKWAITVPVATPAASAQWSTDRAGMTEILTAVLNGSTVTVVDRTSDGKTHLNQPATDAANEKAEKVKAEWKRWLWEDDSRRTELARLYNDIFNTDVLRKYDGMHLTLPGKVSDDIIDLRPHQKAFVWRNLQSSTALADHVVGAGKTFALIASIMEKRRTGQAKKPMLTVPNHLVGQWAADFVKLYPGAKVLATTKKDFDAENRKRLFARIITGDWDVVIVAHSSFGRIGVSPEFEKAFISKQMADLEASMTELRAETGEKSRNVAQLAKWRENLNSKLLRLLDAGAKDDGLTFDEMGIDDISVDEAHEFKNLAFATSMTRVAGLGNPMGSQKAADLYMKIQSITSRNGGRGVTFATGTPLSNTMAEMYTVQRYLDPKGLEALGVAHFDAWARVFGEVVSDWELSPSGQYKLKSRFSKFVNMPELMKRYLSFADVITNDDIKAQLAAIGKKLPLPKVQGGKPTNVVVERSRDQANYIGVGTTNQYGNLEFPKGSLVYRAENLPKGKPEKGADNMLKVMSDARKAALDMRLIDPSYPDVPGSKVHVSADNMRRIYDKWNAKRGTQLVFIDLSTPKKARAKEEARIRDLMKKAEGGDEAAQETLDNMSPDEFEALNGTFSVYDDLKQKLLDRGIPENEIAFIHDANTDAQKEELFGKVRSGRVRLLFGSTAKMGAGTNVQNRLVALHHLDAPWRPSDLEQRDGRGIRQGNELYAEDPDGFALEILRYATKNTLDARQWQTIEGKARFIQQVRKGGSSTREIEDIAGEASNAAEMKAAASGNPLILEEMDLRQKLRRLTDQGTEHDREQHRILGKVKDMRNEIERNTAKLPTAEADAESARSFFEGNFAATIEGKDYDKPGALGAAIIAAGRRMIEDKVATTVLGKIGAFKLDLEHRYGKAYQIEIKGKGEYDVFLDDITEADPVGTGQRVANTLRRLPAEPQNIETRNAELAAQIPPLEKQLGPWEDAGKLAETAKRHQDVLAQLRPKPQPAPTATTVTAPAQPDRTSIGLANAAFHDVASLRSELEAGVGGRLVSGLLKSGRLTIGTARELRGPHMAVAWASDDGRIWMAADRVAHGRGTAVLLHEAFHSGRDALFAGKTWETLMDRLGQLYRQFDRSQAGAQGFFQAARVREAKARDIRGPMLPSLRVEEFGAYAVEEYEAAPGAAKRWVDDVVGAIKAWVLRRFGRQVGELTPAELRALAIVALRDGSITSTPDSRNKRFSIASTTGARTITENRIVDEVKGRFTDFMPSALAAIPLNYFTELARPTMTAVGEYLRVKRVLDAYRGKKHAAADVIAQEWLKYARLGLGKGGKAKAAILAQLMHDATLAGADPSQTDKETVSKRGYDALRATYLSLSPAGRALFAKVRDAYVEQADELDQILLDNVRKAQEIARKTAEKDYKAELERINAANMQPMAKQDALKEASDAYKASSTRSTWSAKARLTKMRMAFEASRVPTPYFPLARFGRYFVTVRDVDGTVLSFSRRERAIDRDMLAGDMRDAFPTAKVEVGVVENVNEMRQAMDPRMVAEIEEIVGGAGFDSATLTTVMDQIWQRYLQTMPDLSARKRFIHRKGVEGFDSDALRAFSSHMFHAGHQMGRLKYGLELQELTNEASDQARKSDDPTRGMTLANELRLRHKWVMNPTGSSVAQIMSSAAFVWYLGATPAAAIVNMTQTPMIGIPVLAGKYGGFAKASAAVLKASFDSVVGKGSVQRANLTAEEQAALEHFYESGLIDRTQSHDLAGVGDTGVRYSPLKAKVMGVLSWAFHRTEVWNREVTALAAFRMAKAAGEDFTQAVDSAHDLTWKTHFDYSNSSRPRLMQNDFAKVALVFRSYNINMLYRVFRDIHQAFKGETPQARKQARYQAAGVVGMMSLLGGVSGVVGFNVMMMLAGALLGDDDDPMDFEQQFRKDVLDILGPQLGGVVLNGVPGHYAGIDLTSRIGMPDLWFRSPTKDLQGKDEFDYWVMNSLGASVSMLGQAFQGISLVADGNVERGVETMAPKWMRDLMKSYRYLNEGVTNLKGDEILPADQISAWDTIAQAIGFTPAKVSETYDRNSALQNAEKRVQQKRQQLVNQFALATRMGDEDGRAEALAAIKKFNKVPLYRSMPITVETLHQSLKTRDRNDKKREDGVLIENRPLGKKLRSMLPERVY